MTNKIPNIFCVVMYSPMMMQLKIAVKTGIKLLYIFAFAAPSLLKANAHNV